MTRSRPIRRRHFLAALGTTALAGCLGDSGEPTFDAWNSYEDLGPMELDFEAPAMEPNLDVSVEPVIENLEIAWDLDYDSEGNLWVTERTGQVSYYDSTSVEAVTQPRDAIDAETASEGWWVEGGEGGTLGLAVSPSDDYLFVYYTADVGTGIENRVIRYEIDGPEVLDEELIIEGIPADNVHNGGRLTFGPDGYLWVTIGDAGEPENARDPSELNGKILRVDEDGEAAPENPDLGGDDRIYAGGLRNPQGLDWIEDEWPIVTDHGPGSRDAISLLYKGGDYGWNDVRGADGDPDYGEYSEHPEVVPPLAHSRTRPSWANSGLTWYTGDAVPSWSNRVIVGLLRGHRVLVVTVTPEGQERLMGGGGGDVHDDSWTDSAATATIHTTLEGGDGIGRVRLVTQGPNGELYALTSNWDGRANDPFPLPGDDRVVRLVQN